MTYDAFIKSAYFDEKGYLQGFRSRSYRLKAKSSISAQRKANHLFFEDTGAHVNTMYGGYFHLRPVPDENLI